MAFVAVPINVGGFRLQHVQVHLPGLDAAFDHQFAKLAHTAGGGQHLDRLGIAEQDSALLDGGVLFAEQQFAGPSLERIGGLVEDVADDDVRHLIDEQPRQGHVAGLKKP